MEDEASALAAMAVVMVAVMVIVVVVLAAPLVPTPPLPMAATSPLWQWIPLSALQARPLQQRTVKENKHAATCTP